MGKKDLSSVESTVELAGRLYQGETLTTSIIERDLDVKYPAAKKRLDALAKLPGIGPGKTSGPSLVMTRPLQAREPVGGNAVAGVCLVSSLVTALHETAMSEPVAKLRREWLSRSKRSYDLDDLDRKFWFVVRGGEKALPQGATRLGDVIDAILESKEITFDYSRFDGSGEKRVRIRPLTLAIHEHQFYVIGTRLAASGDADAEPPHPFRFGRMTNVRSGKSFTYPSGGQYHPRRLFQGVFGIFIDQRDSLPERVHLRFASRWRAYVESHRWHETQEELPVQKDGTIELTMLVRVCHELQHWIIGFGAGVEVIAPARLRTAVATSHRAGAALYAAKTVAKRPAVDTPRRKDR